MFRSRSATPPPPCKQFVKDDRAACILDPMSPTPQGSELTPHGSRYVELRQMLCAIGCWAGGACAAVQDSPHSHMQTLRIAPPANFSAALAPTRGAVLGLEGPMQGSPSAAAHAGETSAAGAVLALPWREKSRSKKSKSEGSQSGAATPSLPGTPSPPGSPHTPPGLSLPGTPTSRSMSRILLRSRDRGGSPRSAPEGGLDSEPSSLRDPDSSLRENSVSQSEGRSSPRSPFSRFTEALSLTPPRFWRRSTEDLPEFTLGGRDHVPRRRSYVLATATAAATAAKAAAMQAAAEQDAAASQAITYRSTTMLVAVDVDSQKELTKLRDEREAQWRQRRARHWWLSRIELRRKNVSEPAERASWRVPADHQLVPIVPAAAAMRRRQYAYKEAIASGRGRRNSFTFTGVGGLVGQHQQAPSAANMSSGAFSVISVVGASIGRVRIQGESAENVKARATERCRMIGVRERAADLI